MKKLKFYQHLAKMILDGTKTTTWRLFDDKNLSVGDEVICVNTQTNEEFSKIKIISVKETTLGKLSKDEFQGHEEFNSKKEMYETYRKYYGDKVGPETPLKVIKFEVL